MWLSRSRKLGVRKLVFQDLPHLRTSGNLLVGSYALCTPESNQEHYINPCLAYLIYVADLQTFEFQGCRLAYRISGNGPPLLMLQGVAVYGASGWNPQVEILEKQY